MRKEAFWGIIITVLIIAFGIGYYLITQNIKNERILGDLPAAEEVR